MFESIRDAFRDLLQQNPDPDTRRDALVQMRETLVRARLGVDDLRRALASTEKGIAAERASIETMRRRRTLAERINDTETVQLATRFESQHAERLTVLERKLSVQRDELALVEREVEEMTTDFKLASKGGTPGLGASRGPVGGEWAGNGPESPTGSGFTDSADTSAFDQMDHRRDRAEREAKAEEMLEALKRRMGK